VIIKNEAIIFFLFGLSFGLMFKAVIKGRGRRDSVSASLSLGALIFSIVVAYLIFGEDMAAILGATLTVGIGVGLFFFFALGLLLGAAGEIAD
jgi:hypothetical protein